MNRKAKTYEQVLAEFHAVQRKHEAEFNAIRAKYKWGSRAFDKAFDAQNRKVGQVGMKWDALLDSYEDRPRYKPNLSEFAETLLESSGEDEGDRSALPKAAVSGLMKMRDAKKPTLTKAEAKAIWGHIGDWPDDSDVFEDIASAKRFCKRFM
jgi:hypothetical protein